MNEKLPEGWASARLNAFTSAIQYGYTASAEPAIAEPRLLRITDIQDGRVNWTTVPGCTIDQDDLTKYRLAPGDIVFARSGATTGKSFLIRECPANAVFASYLIRVRAHERIVLPEYLSNYFQTPSYWADITDRLAGNAQPNCNGSKLAGLIVPVAPLPEQHRIVSKVEALLEQVNRAKERLDRVPLILKRFRQAVLAAACSGELTQEWRERESSTESASNWVLSIHERRSLRRRVSSEEAPRTEPVATLSGWCETRIGDVTECLDSIRKPINREERAARPGTVPYYGANGQVGWIDTHIFDEDLVLVVEDETFIGRDKPFSYIIRGRSWVNNHAHVLRALGGMSPEYLNYCLSYYDFVPLTSGTTGRRKLTKGALMEAPLLVAPLDEQEEILRRAGALLTLADNIERRLLTAISRAQKLPQAILSKAFSGELVPTEAELARIEGRTFETAEELLKRVRDGAAPTPTKARGRRKAEETSTTAAKQRGRGRAAPTK